MTENNTTTYAVGQSLYWESSPGYSGRSSGRNGDVTITKVGRKWLELSNGYRVDKATLFADPGNYSPPGRCFVDKEKRLAEHAKQDAWNELHRRIAALTSRGRAPQQISMASIQQILVLLDESSENDK